jgi:hypothetical protein
VSAGMLGQLAKTLNKLIDDGVWERDVELEVKIAGTLKSDKFIVIKPIKEKMVCNSNPELKQQHPYQGEN